MKKNLKNCRELLTENEHLADVSVNGWVRTKRDSKDFTFLEINDGSCLSNLQVIIVKETAGYAFLNEVNTGSAVNVVGDLVESPGKGQRWEIKAKKLLVIGSCDPDFPLQKKRHSDEFLRTIAHLRPRTNKFGAMARIRSRTSWAIHQFFQERDFHLVHTPIITGSDCEGAGEMFKVVTERGDSIATSVPQEEFFGKDAYLTVSGQLSVETYCQALSKVYTFGPTFRSENSNTARHMAEFWMIEPEIAFANIIDDMNLAEDFVKNLTKSALERSEEDITLFARYVDKNLSGRLQGVLDKEFARISYKEALEILERSNLKFEYPVQWGNDLQTEHERYLSEEYFNGPVFVYDWPKEIKAFYMRLNDDGRTVAAMDLIVPGSGELIGGSAREERLDALSERMVEMKIDRESYWWYLDTRRFGSVPHCGFGLGLERFLMFLTGVTNIRDVIPFPRTPKSLEF
jgi:asparaginyl-tRNA synthetase